MKSADYISFVGLTFNGSIADDAINVYDCQYMTFDRCTFCNMAGSSVMRVRMSRNFKLINSEFYCYGQILKQSHRKIIKKHSHIRRDLELCECFFAVEIPPILGGVRKTVKPTYGYDHRSVFMLCTGAAAPKAPLCKGSRQRS